MQVTPCAATKRMKREKKAFLFELKEVSDTGAFVGLASTYGHLDLGGDIVDKGAFTKTLAERGADVPILWQHDQTIPIGLGTLEDTADGLVIKGQLDLDVEEGARAYSGMKKGYLKGLSIGYTVVKQAYANSARHLKEVKVYEVSTVTFPMNEEATVQRVKAFDPTTIDIKSLALPPAIEAAVAGLLTKAASLSDRVTNTYRAVRAKYPLSNAYPLSDEIYDDHVIVSSGCYDNSAAEYYSVAITAWDADGVPTLGDATEVMRAYVPVTAPEEAAEGEIKAGRVLSSANHDKLKSACDYMTKALEHVSHVVSAAEPKDPKASILGTSRKEAAGSGNEPHTLAALGEIAALITATNTTLRATAN
jgi:HK97 family phage prohead protease